MDGRGISIDDLPDIYREEYLYAVEMARGLHDPFLEWEEFTETLWRYLVRAFGLDVVTSASVGTGADGDTGGLAGG